jgi:uncharacterized heparinase superfamily protein
MTSATHDTTPSPTGSSQPSEGLLGRLIFRSALYRMSLRGRRPNHLRLVVPVSWPENRAAAEALLDGKFEFHGRRHSLGGTPWLAVAQRPYVAAALHSFSWLGDLRAIGSKAAQLRARHLVDDWIESNSRWSTPAWAPAVLGRRVSAWLTAADFLLTSANEPFPPRFYESAAVQARHLRRVAGSTSGTANAFAAGKGMLFAALCLGIGRTEAAIKFLCREAERQILPDGGHVQRCPALHLEVMRDLLDVRSALQAARIEIPANLLGGIERMVPMLRALRLGDGSLALFHGGKEGDRRLLDAVLARSGVKSKPVDDGRYAGFQRLAAGRTAIVLDAGPPPQGRADRLGHAAPLAFEMSIGRERLVVNCGSFAGDDRGWRDAMRSADAHSTLIVKDASIAEIRPDERLAGRPIEVTVERRESEGSIWVEASHDGYRRHFGVIHVRRLYLHESGDDVRGEDRLDGPGREPFKIRFHLHPDVMAATTGDSGSVLLTLPGGTEWRFVAAGGVVTLEESVYLGSSDMPKRGIQIVIKGAPKEDSAEVKWAFQREDSGD